jgi:hypothetical protein
MVTIVTLLLGQIALFWICYEISKGKALSGYICIFIVSLLILAKAVFNYRPDYEILIFNYDWYILYNGIILFVLESGFFGCVMAFLESTRDKRAIGVLAIVVALYGQYMNFGFEFQKSIGNDNYVNSDHHIRQSSPYTCGPASCVIAASYCGISVSENEMIQRCLTNGRGTSLLNIYRGMRLTIDRKLYNIEMSQLKFPELVKDGRVSLAISGNHAICLLGRGDHVLVHDTQKENPEEWDEEDVMDRCNSVLISISRI